MHIDAVWLMGVWERSPRGIAISNANPGNLADFRRALPDFLLTDNAGSAYCIRRYATEMQLGGDEGLAIARHELARRGIRLILDFVPNHLAHDHPWVTEFPEYFIQGSEQDLESDPVTFTKINGQVFACGKDPFYPAWQDVLQVNAFHPGLRNAQIESLRRIATMCDGVRCDMAMLVMNGIFEKNWGDRAGSKPVTEYWEELIPAVKRANRAFLFIAEAYWDTEWKLLNQGFDYCYDKRLYDRLARGPAGMIREHLTADPEYQAGMLRFIENHDELRQAEVFSNGQDKAAAITIATLPGAKLYHEGQMEGRRVRLPVFLNRRVPEPPDESLHEFYLELFECVSDPLFRKGNWQTCTCYGWPDNHSYINFLAWQWTDRGDCCLVVVNYSTARSDGMVRITGFELAGSQWVLADPLNGTTFVRDGNELQEKGLFVGLNPWKFHFFRLYPA